MAGHFERSSKVARSETTSNVTYSGTSHALRRLRDTTQFSKVNGKACHITNSSRTRQTERNRFHLSCRKINFFESSAFRLIQFDPGALECYSSMLSSHCWAGWVPKSAGSFEIDFSDSDTLMNQEDSHCRASCLRPRLMHLLFMPQLIDLIET